MIRRITIMYSKHHSYQDHSEPLFNFWIYFKPMQPKLMLGAILTLIAYNVQVNKDYER